MRSPREVYPHFLFLHVPKTAGSMFRAIVKRNFGPEVGIENPLMSEQVYTTAQIDAMFAHYPFRFLMGHVFRLDPSLRACGGKVQLISFVRDPIDKARSAYYYLAGRELTRSDHPAKQKSFAEMCDLISESNGASSFLLDSSQLTWLVGREGAKVEEVERSCASGRLLLFPTEEFDQACVVLERLFPKDFSDCSYGQRSNVSRRRDGADIQAERAAAEKLPWISQDRELHALAKANVARLWSEAFANDEESDAAVTQFRKRCSERADGRPTSAGVARRKKSFLARLFGGVR